SRYPCPQRGKPYLDPGDVTLLCGVEASRPPPFSPGQQAVLSCNIERYDGNYVSWYKQVPGEAPQYVLGFRHSGSSLSFGTGFSSDRLNSKASSNINYQFIIKQAETGDSAQYFCQTYDNSTSAYKSHNHREWICKDT
uniref:Ig-like domain-containing protein n=1 Tax=Pundamilia nyererei TaxID=303518 RepID=A0A3B4FS12_9CICH